MAIEHRHCPRECRRKADGHYLSDVGERISTDRVRIHVFSHSAMARQVRWTIPHDSVHVPAPFRHGENPSAGLIGGIVVESGGILSRLGIRMRLWDYRMLWERVVASFCVVAYRRALCIILFACYGPNADPRVDVTCWSPSTYRWCQGRRSTCAVHALTKHLALQKRTL